MRAFHKGRIILRFDICGACTSHSAELTEMTHPWAGRVLEPEWGLRGVLGPIVRAGEFFCRYTRQKCMLHNDALERAPGTIFAQQQGTPEGVGGPANVSYSLGH